MMATNCKKLVIVGDGGCGKTCLLFAFVNNEFSIDYVPTVFENYMATIDIGNGQTLPMVFFDTAGQEEYDRLRPLVYTSADIFLICYSIASIESFKNVTEKWIPEVVHYCPGVPIFLVGTMVDLRGCEALKTISLKEGQRLATEIKVKGHFECSAKTGEGVKEVFVAAAKQTLKKDWLKGKCVIL